MLASVGMKCRNLDGLTKRIDPKGKAFCKAGGTDAGRFENNPLCCKAKTEVAA